MNIRKCKYCNEEFIPKDRRSNFCSSLCKYMAASRTKRIKQKEKRCANCGKMFSPYNSTDKYCSWMCRDADIRAKRKTNWSDEKRQKRRGFNNPAYRNGDRVRGKKQSGIGIKLFTRNAISIENQMISEKGYKHCQLCGVTNPIKFERHHIIYRSEKPGHKSLHSKENILIVCITCHNDLHKSKGLRNKIVEERGLNLIFGNDVLNK
jgi:hypothetical protein